GVGRRRDSSGCSASVIKRIVFEPDRWAPTPAGDAPTHSAHAFDTLCQRSEWPSGFASEWLARESGGTRNQTAPRQAGTLGAWPFHAAILRCNSGSPWTLF